MRYVADVFVALADAVMRSRKAPVSGRMYTLRLAVIRCLICVLLSIATLAAQTDHGYTTADIERGGQLFLTSCANCHGPDGDALAGVDLSTGRFRRAVSDDELVKIIQSGIPGTAMPPSNYPERQATAIVAFLRTMNRSGAVLPM